MAAEDTGFGGVGTGSSADETIFDEAWATEEGVTALEGGMTVNIVTVTTGMGFRGVRVEDFAAEEATEEEAGL